MPLEEQHCEDCGDAFNPLEVAKTEAGSALTAIFDSLDDWEAAAKEDDVDESGGLTIHIGMQILDLIESLMDLRYAVIRLQVQLENSEEEPS